jgi:DNA polymerase-3 subunit gamma/tau
MARLALGMPADETQLLYSLCLHGRAELGLAPDEYAAMTMVLLRLLAFKPGSALVAAAEKKTLKSAIESVPLPAGLQVLAVINTTQKPPVRQAYKGNDAAKIIAIPVRQEPEASARAEPLLQPQSSPPVQSSPEGDFWFDVVQQLVAAEAITALVRELALQSQLVARDTGHWLLRIERESLNQPTARERLQTALASLGHAVHLGVEVGRVLDSPARRLARIQAEKQEAAEVLLGNDPFVQAMVRDFGAKIVPGSVKPAA